MKPFHFSTETHLAVLLTPMSTWASLCVLYGRSSRNILKPMVSVWRYRFAKCFIENYMKTFLYYFKSWYINSLAPGRPRCHSCTAIFNLVLLIGIFTSSMDNALRPRDLTDDKSTLVQVMAWCCQATSHYLTQSWPSSMSTYGITRPQWVKDGVLNSL